MLTINVDCEFRHGIHSVRFQSDLKVSKQCFYNVADYYADMKILRAKVWKCFCQYTVDGETC